MNPFFFGSSQRSLYGAHDAPKARTPREAGVVLCPPMGHEYMRTHKALRQLALQLSRSGFHVLRFDYYGTGDSSGEGAEGSVEQWLEDIALAAEEIKDAGGVSKVALVGLRLGATLAAAAAARRRDVDALVLWDPIVSGSAYLEELLRAPGEAGEPAAAIPLPANGQPAGVRGFPMSAALAEGLKRLDLLSLRSLPARRALLVVSEETGPHGRLKDHLGPLGAFTYRHIPSQASWERVDEFGAMVLPQQVIAGINEYLAAEARP